MPIYHGQGSLGRPWLRESPASCGTWRCLPGWSGHHRRHRLSCLPRGSGRSLRNGGVMKVVCRNYATSRSTNLASLDTVGAHDLAATPEIPAPPPCAWRNAIHPPTGTHSLHRPPLARAPAQAAPEKFEV